MKLKALAALTLLSLAACTDPTAATRALTAAGYSEIRVTGYRFFGCANEDLFHTGFEAKGPTGIDTAGVVCTGLFKGSTIRSD